MSIEPEHKEFEDTEALIDELVHIHYSIGRDDLLDHKLDLLERTIELLRIRKRHLKNDLRLEDYIQSDLFCDSKGFHFLNLKAGQSWKWNSID